MLFRGIVEIILDVNSLKNFPAFYNAIGWRNWWIFPICMVLYIIITVIFYFVLHRSTFGRKLLIENLELHVCNQLPVHTGNQNRNQKHNTCYNLPGVGIHANQSELEENARKNKERFS